MANSIASGSIRSCLGLVFLMVLLIGYCYHQVKTLASITLIPQDDFIWYPIMVDSPTFEQQQQQSTSTTSINYKETAITAVDFDMIRIPRVNDKNICPNKVRAGDEQDGGWWICHGNKRTNCVVYSFGIRDNFSFDHYMVQHHQCEVHGFDPSPVGLASQEQYELSGTTDSTTKGSGSAQYHSYGLGSRDSTFGPGKVPFRWPGLGYLQDSNTQPWKLKRLPTIMKELKTMTLTILKVDVEGAEWDMLPDLINTDWEEAFMELHFPPSDYLLSTPTPHVLEIQNRNRNSEKSPLQQRPEQNVEPIDRLVILQNLLDVADVFHWDRNGEHCVEIYLVKK